MQETKDSNTASSAANKEITESKDRFAEATSSETLSDLEETQSESRMKSGTVETGEDSPVPSPDGTSVANRSERADGSDTGGPM